MGKVKIVNKSRNEYKCMKCNKIIPVGSMYYRGELNFSKDIIRCADCKLESWEVTTSDYQLAVGRIVNKWREDYDSSIDGAEAIVEDLESIRDDLQCRLDNIPEGLQDGDIGQLLQERIDSLDSAIDELNNIDEESLKDEVIDEYESEELDEELDGDSEEDIDWDDDNEDMVSALSDKISDEIDSALSNVEY